MTIIIVDRQENGVRRAICPAYTLLDPGRIAGLSARPPSSIGAIGRKIPLADHLRREDEVQTAQLARQGEVDTVTDDLVVG